jgi:hypothetical protein
MSPQLDDAEISVRLPVAFESLKDIEATDGSLTSNMEASFLPGAELPSHVYELWFLEVGHGSLLFVVRLLELGRSLKAIG